MQSTVFDLQSLLSRLEALGEEKYRRFNEGLIPGAENTSLGVRLPALRAIARELLRQNWRGFLDVSADHPIHEIRMLHGMVLGGAKCDIDEKLQRADAFLPQVSNWAICDTFCASFKPRPAEMAPLFDFVRLCAASDAEFRKRFGLVMMMNYFRDDPWIDRVLEAYRAFSHDGYYARMGAAWGLATLFAFHRDQVLALIQENRLDDFTHNMAIRKMIESYRVSDGDKQMLRALRRPTRGRRPQG